MRSLAAIPHEDLAVQWDVASEMGIIERAAGYGAVMEAWWPGDPFDGLVERLAALVDAVPAGVEVGVHLCYGDAGEKHFFEPTDAANLVRYANAVAAASARPLTWLHLPVPIAHDDAAYFAPLADLAPVNELYLGLVHREDGAEGAARRIAAASPYTPEFGVANRVRHRPRTRRLDRRHPAHPPPRSPPPGDPHRSIRALAPRRVSYSAVTCPSGRRCNSRKVV